MHLIDCAATWIFSPILILGLGLILVGVVVRLRR